MTDDRGWLPAHRRIYDADHWLAPSKRDPSCRRDAWLYMCQMAVWRDTEHARSGTLRRGEFVASLRSLGDVFCWSKDRVKRFMSDLEVRTAIETVRETPDGTVYRVVNYDTYAGPRGSERDSGRDSKRDRSETAARQEEEVKKKRRTTRARGNVSPLPEEWTPNDAHQTRCAEMGLDVGDQADRFRTWHGAKGSLFSNWDQAFHNWILKAKDFGTPTKANNPPSRLPSLREASAWLPRSEPAA